MTFRRFSRLWIKDHSTTYHVDYDGKHYVYFSQEFVDGRMRIIAIKLCLQLILGIDPEHTKHELLSVINPWILNLQSRYKFYCDIIYAPKSNMRPDRALQNWAKEFHKKYGFPKNKCTRQAFNDAVDLVYYLLHPDNNMEDIINNPAADLRNPDYVSFYVRMFDQSLIERDKANPLI